MSMNKVIVVTVTYGERLKYVDKVVNEVAKYDAVKEIVVVNNGSYNGDLPLHKKNKVHIINSKRNGGSAVGYAKGLEYAFLTDNDFIWLLDDDNCPKNGCLDGLLSLYNSHYSSDNNLYTAFRDDRLELKASGRQHYKQNSFFGFSLEDKLLHHKSLATQNSRKSLIQCDSVPYGGLLLPMRVAKRNGLPNKNYYLYNDDNDYTYRLTKLGYTIFCSLDYIIHDLEQSWYRRESLPMFQGFFRTKMLRNGVYTIRNRTYFEITHIVDNKIIYYFNIFIYLLYVFLFYMPKNTNGFKRYQLVCRMIKAGLNGKLGKIKSTMYDKL